MKNTIKAALATPRIRLCDPEYNAGACALCAKEAEEAGAEIIVFPELVLTGATAGDLYFQDILIEAAESALSSYVKSTAGLGIMSFIGLPIKHGQAIYNAVACVLSGEIVGVSASALETRHFSSIRDGFKTVLAGFEVEVARDNIYTCEGADADVFVKVGDDNAFSSDSVNLIVNPIAMVEHLGLRSERREYAMDVSASLGIPYLIVGAGEGESGTDGIYAAPKLVSVSGEIIAECESFDESTLYAEIDTRVKKSKPRSAPEEAVAKRFPFVPEEDRELELAFEIQSRSLAHRIERAYAKCAVIGVSGGLDSTLAVLVAARAMDIAGYSRDNVIAITMPCFGTTERTKGNALALAEELGCTVRTIDIKAAVNQHFKDISHDEKKYDVVYENAQARERTQILMDVANAEGGMVIGTGDLSELALGFATYNGDHMSMYCVNGSVPKTLMRAMIGYLAEKHREEGRERLASVLYDIVNTPVSPELLPVEDGESKQHTEEIVGPYELHDFFLYYTVKLGYSPSRILSLASEVFSDYDVEEVRSYLDIFVRRFFSQQFKRSCLPDGPRVTEISLSPRGAWQMPSDVSSAVWKADLARKVNNE